MSEKMPPIGVVIPVYNRPETLSRTLASLEAQDVSPDQLTVVIADDGSEEDVESVVTEWDPPFEKRYVRQQHVGFGAARARNLGARTLEEGIVVFLDSDGLVRPDFISNHLRWFTDNAPRVVIGGRVHLRAGDLSLEHLRAGETKLEGSERDGRPDFRSVLSRRTSGYRHTDEGYRAFVSSNVALPLSLHREVGGFDTRFRWWGSEDTEYGWRLWQAGAEFVDHTENAIYHQLDTDTAGGDEGRQHARDLNRGLLTSLVPQRFYRKGMPDPPPEVPKISVIVHDVPDGAPQELWRQLRAQTLPDFEVAFVARAADHDPFAGAAEGESRISFDADFDAVVGRANGEYVVFVSGYSALSRTFLHNIVKRLDQRPAALGLTFGVAVADTGAYGLRDDVLALAKRWGCEYPVSLAVRRRWLARQAREGMGLSISLEHALTSSMHTRHAVLALPSEIRADRPDPFVFGGTEARQIWEEAQLGPKQAMKAGLRAVERRLRPPRPSKSKSQAENETRLMARYIGWVGKDNLGDEAMLRAAVRLMAWADVSARGEAKDLLLLGGGTLINRNQYLGWLVERDSPRLERAVLGTGVASPAYWGITEDPTEWKRWLRTCSYVGVRGPHSLETLSRWGASANVEICGDLALALESPQVEVVDGRVLIAPASTSGKLWGGSDEAVYRDLAGAAATWIDQGREVVLMSCHPSDDRPILMIRDLLEGRPTLYLAGYLDMDESMKALAAASVVIGERLHACVLAAAAGRPFLGLEYRPKVLDFAASVAMESHVIRTDKLTSGALIDQVAGLIETPQEMVKKVADYRRRLAAASETIRGALKA